jgi:hypothetical protein
MRITRTQILDLAALVQDQPEDAQFTFNPLDLEEQTSYNDGWEIGEHDGLKTWRVYGGGLTVDVTGLTDIQAMEKVMRTVLTQPMETKDA